MNPLYIGLVVGIVGGVAALVGSAINKARDNNPKNQKKLEDFRQEVTARLEPEERLEASCGYKPCVAVTTRHIFIQTKEGLDRIPLADVAKAKGMNQRGDKTTYPQSMISMTLKLRSKKKYVIGKYSEGFCEVAQEIDRKIGFS